MSRISAAFSFSAATLEGINADTVANADTVNAAIAFKNFRRIIIPPNQKNFRNDYNLTKK